MHVSQFKYISAANILQSQPRPTLQNVHLNTSLYNHTVACMRPTNQHEPYPLPMCMHVYINVCWIPSHTCKGGGRNCEHVRQRGAGHQTCTTTPLRLVAEYTDGARNIHPCKRYAKGRNQVGWHISPALSLTSLWTPWQSTLANVAIQTKRRLSVAPVIGALVCKSTIEWKVVWIS